MLSATLSSITSLRPAKQTCQNEEITKESRKLLAEKHQLRRNQHHHKTPTWNTETDRSQKGSLTMSPKTGRNMTETWNTWHQTPGTVIEGVSQTTTELQSRLENQRDVSSDLAKSRNHASWNTGTWPVQEIPWHKRGLFIRGMEVTNNVRC